MVITCIAVYARDLLMVCDPPDEPSGGSIYHVKKMRTGILGTWTANSIFDRERAVHPPP